MFTPIFIPISGGSGKTESDHKCPECGHEFDDPTEDININPRKIITVLLFIVLLVLSVIYFQKPFRVWYYDQKEMPNFIMNSKYTIETDGDNYFLVKNNYGKYYLSSIFEDAIYFNYTSPIDSKKLVSKNHALWIYYKHIYKPSVKTSNAKSKLK